MHLRRVLCRAHPRPRHTLAAHVSVDSAFYQSLNWRLVGPFGDGRVLTVARIPGEMRYFHFGSVDGGVRATAEVDRTWQPILHVEKVDLIGALVLAPMVHRRT